MLRRTDLPNRVSNENECSSHTAIEELIEISLEHFAFDDAVILAEAYNSRVETERSLLILAHCLTRTQNLEGAYYLLKVAGSVKTAQSRYTYALSAFSLNRLQESESILRDERVMDKIELHPSFHGTLSLPYAHALLAKVLCETNRVSPAKSHWASAIRQCPFLWTSVRSYCEVWGVSIRDHLQPWLKLVSESKIQRKSISEESVNNERISGNSPGSKFLAERGLISSTPERRKVRFRNVGTDARYSTTNSLSNALRASENSPLIRFNNANTEATLKHVITSPLIELKQQKKDEEQNVLSDKRITRRAAAAAAAASKEKNRTTNPINGQERHFDALYCELVEWFVQLAEVQEHLSHFRTSNAHELLNSLNPFLSTLPLTLELRARIFFENGEYKRSCEIFEEIQRLYPRHVRGMEIYSTALWQLHDFKKLSALASKMIEIARDQPQTWCIAGNCFSVEKQHETAIECFERAIRLDHRFGYAYSLLGHELIDMNDLNRAAQAFRKAIQFLPNDYRAWYGLGLVHFKEEQLQLAKINLLRAVNINPNNTVLLCQFAVIEQALHNADSAMRYLEHALKNSPNNVACRFHKARLLFDTGHYEAARKELEELRVLSPDEAHVFFLLGRVNRKLGNTHMALLNFSWATEIDPRGEQNQSALTQDKGPYDDEPI